MNKNIETNRNSTSTFYVPVMVVSRKEMEAKREAIAARNKLQHIPALLKDKAREELFVGSKVGAAIAFDELYKHKKELYARFGRYYIKTAYDSGDMMWHIYLM